MTEKKKKPAGPKKCSRAGYCWAMSEQAEMDPNSRSKGLSELRLTSFDSGTTRTAGIRYRRTASDRGLMLNNCPWCGESIKFWDKP